MKKNDLKAAANVAAQKLANQNAGILIYDSEGKKMIEHKFKFKDTFRDSMNRIWIDVDEQGDVIGRWMMFQYEWIVELVRIGIIDSAKADGRTERIFLLDY